MQEETAERLYEVTNGEFRKIMTWLHYLEEKAKINSMEAISPELIDKTPQ